MASSGFSAPPASSPPAYPSTPSTGPPSSPPPAYSLHPRYQFPIHNLYHPSDPKKTPIVLVLPGCFNPPTINHLNLFQRACHFVNNTIEGQKYEIIGGYFSVVSDAYGDLPIFSRGFKEYSSRAGLEVPKYLQKKAQKPLPSPELILADDRYNLLCILISHHRHHPIARGLPIDPWESHQFNRHTNEPIYRPTIQVLQHFQTEVNKVVPSAKVVLLAGSEMLNSMDVRPYLWRTEDMICGKFGIFEVLQGNEKECFAGSLLGGKEGWGVEVLPRNINVGPNSKQIRRMLKGGRDVSQFLPRKMIEYIKENTLYQPEVRCYE
ncbi:hypothetical protein B0J14DRAFT_669296 [Halenospora varia]|nr:hypothetical protein B0J14DRAFT_669296 [Halenospora varia]